VSAIFICLSENYIPLKIHVISCSDAYSYIDICFITSIVDFTILKIDASKPEDGL